MGIPLWTCTTQWRRRLVSKSGMRSVRYRMFLSCLWCHRSQGQPHIRYRRSQSMALLLQPLCRIFPSIQCPSFRMPLRLTCSYDLVEIQLRSLLFLSLSRMHSEGHLEQHANSCVSILSYPLVDEALRIFWWERSTAGCDPQVKCLSRKYQS